VNHTLFTPSLIIAFIYQGKEEMYVAAYSSQLVMHTKMKGAERTFAVAKCGKRMNPENLADAYKRSGKSFRGLLQQNFVVLKDEMEPATIQPSGGYGAGKWKRKRTGQQTVVFGREGEVVLEEIEEQVEVNEKEEGGARSTRKGNEWK
jgi:hypothetical protein